MLLSVWRAAADQLPQRHEQLQTDALQQFGRNFGVQRIIFHEEHLASDVTRASAVCLNSRMQNGFALLVRCVREGELHREGRALAERAFDVQRAAHQVSETFDNRHAQSGALNLGHAAVLCAGVVLADVLDEFLAHADAVIRAGEAIAFVR